MQSRREFSSLTLAMAAISSSQPPARKPIWTGVQIGPHSFYDEGFERCLDLLESTAGVNTVMVYSHSYYSAAGLDGRRAPETLAPDHGVPPKGRNGRRLPFVWVRSNETPYKDTFLRHTQPDPELEYAGRDVFNDLLPHCRKRGIKVYARILEPFSPGYAKVIPGWSRILSVDVLGAPGPGTCYNHPAYRAFWQATAEDLLSSYDLDGLQWGSERNGPLSRLLFHGEPPYCFCQYCLAEARARNIDADRARQGFTELYDFVRGMRHGGQKPADGAFIGFLGRLFRYPEILSWESMWRQTHEEFCRQIYSRAKRARPQADVGRHIDHQCSSWDPFYRAEFSYGEIARDADFLKPILYHDVLGPRFRHWCVERLRQSVLGDMSGPEAQSFLYAILGYNARTEPQWDDLERQGFSPEYVHSETKRCVQGAAGKCRVYAGIGIDVPWSDRTLPADPDRTALAARRALEAGADGILISREYDEMRLPSLQAIGRGIREFQGRG
jgi:hypothetical protein